MKVLAVGAHPDDVELGCGAALLAHRARGDSVALLVLTGGEHGPQGQSSRVSEQEIAASILGADLFWGGFEDGAVPEGRAGVTVVEEAIRATGADVVYTHSPRDSHQDHRSAAVATLAAGRLVSRILMYETPSSLGFAPTVFVDAAEHLPGKLKALRAHVSQVLKNQMVDLDAVAAQARFRGFQARLRHAEAFETERFAWDLSGVRGVEPGASRSQASASGVSGVSGVSDVKYAPTSGR